MIKFFRNIRQSLLMENKTSKYLKYAIGEIVLVMIGILLALQVNNWNNYNKDKNLEKRYLSDLLLDLKTDSTAIAVFKKESDEQVRTKNKLNDYFNGQSFPNDSLIYFFDIQWKTVYNFTPIMTTLEEMKSTGNLGVISNHNLRRKILETYNKYQVHIHHNEVIYNRLQEEFWKIILSKIPNLDIYKSGESLNKLDIVTVLMDFEIKNRLNLNHVNGMNTGIKDLQNINNLLIEELQNKNKALQ